MGLRSQIRGLCMRVAVIARLDELALHLKSTGARNKHGIVIEVHETPRSYERQFRRQLEWVAKWFSIVDLDRFAGLFDSPAQSPPDGKPLVLFTFDDGRESNYTVAAPLLESFGARGVFFVVPRFAECPDDQALEFYRSRINPSSKPGDEAWEDWKPMNPAQIADLAARGHAVGNHTLSHAQLGGLSPEELESEIGDGARKINSWTGKPVDTFAWTFTWDSIDPAAWQTIRRYHRFCFAPCPGGVDPRVDGPSLIWRREVEVRYSCAEFRFFYSGLADPAWAGRRRQLRKLLQDNSAGDAQ